MVSEIINLLELVRSLVQRKSELDREYFENFIQPIWQKFDAVHKEYAQVFLDCEKYLKGEKDEKFSYGDDVIIDRLAGILKRSAVTHSERVELSKLLNHIPAQSFENKREILLSNFSKALIIYFDGFRDFSNTWELKSLRRMLKHNFGTLRRSGKFNQENTLYVIDVMLKHIAENYEGVADRYYELRKELLI